MKLIKKTNMTFLTTFLRLQVTNEGNNIKKYS